MIDLDVIIKNNYGLYRKWQIVVNICKNKNHVIHDKGNIDLYSDWYNFRTFYVWSIHNGYDEITKPVIKRKDETADFHPDNCYWIEKEKLLKTLTNPIDGRTQTYNQWAKELGIRTGCLVNRIKCQLPPEKLFAIGHIIKGPKKRKTYKLSKIIQAYYNFMQSCYNPKSHNYKTVGARGIKVYNEWLNNRDKFEHWSLEHGYSADLCLGRIDVNGDYEPDNCVWTTMNDILENKRTNVKLSDGNLILNQFSFAKKIGIRPESLAIRLQHNLPKEQLFYEGSLRHKNNDFRSKEC
jgi:hypothetical protein